MSTRRPRKQRGKGNLADYLKECLLALLGEVELFLSDERNWCHDALALDFMDHKVSWDDSTAIRWNVVGAVFHVGLNYNGMLTLQALGEIGEVAYVLKKQYLWNIPHDVALECMRVVRKNMKDS